MRLDQEKIDRVKEILRARTETEALHEALDLVIRKDEERIRKTRIMKRMLELRDRLGKIEEDSSKWLRAARGERTKSYASGR